jgi:hypothetical protein
VSEYFFPVFGFGKEGVGERFGKDFPQTAAHYGMVIRYQNMHN